MEEDQGNMKKKKIEDMSDEEIAEYLENIWKEQADKYREKEDRRRINQTQ